MDATEISVAVRRMWRIPVVAVLGAILGFVGSYAVSPSYDASTSLLVRGRDATVLSSTGQSLTNQPLIDSNLTTALAETQSALLSTRTVAEMVVDDLGLDQIEPEKKGPVGRVRSLVGGLYSSTKAFLTHGYEATPTKREAAIGMVHSGLAARPRKDSYVIELHASAEDAAMAAAIANSAADALIEVSRTRFQSEAAAYRDFLQSELDAVADQERSTADAVRQYKEEHGIADVGVQQQLTAQSVEQIESDLRDTQVSLQSARSELRSVEKSLSGIEDTNENVSRIETGRSTTEIRNTESSSVHDQMLLRREEIEADIAALSARESALTGLLGGAVSTGRLSEEEAALRQLELQYEIARESYATLSRQHQEAVRTAADDRVELTRLDEASAPSYPQSPVRYLYLGLGGFTGLVVGLMLTALAAWRSGVPLLNLAGTGSRTGERSTTDVPSVIDLSTTPAPNGAGVADPSQPSRTPVGGHELFHGPRDGAHAD